MPRLVSAQDQVATENARMSKQGSMGSFSTRKISFRPRHNRHALHKSWHRKVDTTMNKFSTTNVYRYRNHNAANSSGDNPSSEVAVKTLTCQPAIRSPLTHTAPTSNDANVKEHISATIHVNPLFAGGNVQESNLKVLKNLRPQLTTSDTVTKMMATKVLDPQIVTSVGVTSCYRVPNIGSKIFSNSISNNETNLNSNSVISKSKGLNVAIPSIHVNPSVIVGSTANCLNNIKHSDAMQLYQTIKTMQNSTSTNNQVSSAIAHPCDPHDTVSLVPVPNSMECQRLVHVNPTVLASNVTLNQLSNTKSSVHVNPKTYARLKSEVRKEKPVQHNLTTQIKSKTSASLNRSLISISRTKLVRRGLLRSRKSSFQKSQQSLVQTTFHTPKGKQLLSGLRTPSSAVIKVAKSVCSKYKFIRKCSSSSSSSSLLNSSIKPSFLHSTYKLDRRSCKTPRHSKKVKKYSIMYDNYKYNNYEGNLRRNLGTKRSLSSSNYRFNSKVWKQPGCLVPRKVVITNQKLLRIGDSPRMKSKRNASSSHKTLVRLGGVLYKTSRMKLTRTQNVKRKSIGPKVNKQGFVKKPVNQNHILHVRGNKFLMDRTGMTLKRIYSDKPEQSRLVKRIDIGGVTFIQKSKNVLIRTNTHRARNVLSQAKNKSIAVLTTRMRKNNTHCKFYRQLGKCIGKEKGRCPCIHDPKYITICRKLLKGECNGDGCLLSHELIPEKMPICKFFMLGCCSREACVYLHVQSDPKAPICISFLQGYCPDGSNCIKRHLYICPHFDKNGKCPKSKYCPYPHKLRENLTLNMDHMNRFVSDVPEIKSHDDEPKAEEFRYFRFNKDFQDMNIETVHENKSELQVNHEDGNSILFNAELMEGGETDVDINVRDVITKRHKLFNEVFSLITSDNAQINMPLDVEKNKVVTIEPQLATDSDDTIMLQMAFIDRLSKQTRSDFVSYDDQEWNGMKSSLKNLHKYGKLIQSFALQDEKIPYCASEAANFSYHENLDGGNEVVTCDWVEHLIKQCDVVHRELEKSYIFNKCDDKEINSLVPSVLQLTTYISRSLRDRVNNLNNSRTSIVEDKDSGVNCNVANNLGKLLANLLSVLEVKSDKEDCNHAIQDKKSYSSSSCPALKIHLDTFNLEKQRGVRRCKVGSIPYYISLN